MSTIFFHKTFDIKELLSTKERDFLVRNDGGQVKIDSLIGKFVGLYFMRLPRDCKGAPHPRGLVEAYNRPKDDFGSSDQNDVDSDELLFNECFSKMPWLAIPFFDFGTRKLVGTTFSLPFKYGPECLLLDASGKVLDRIALCYFEFYAADWYPFNDATLEAIEDSEKAALKELSLKNLLASPSRDYLIAKRGKKVPIGDLENKMVGLYFYDGRDHFMQELLAVYEELENKGIDFEIVLINLHFNGGYRHKESFEKKLEEMPWLALPFGDTKCGKLWKMFDCPGYDYDEAGVLVMIRPGEYYEPYGMKIFLTYGIEAYPFTRKRGAELEIERRSLLPLFDAAGQKFVIQRDGTQIQLSDLNGKYLVLFLSGIMRKEYLFRLTQWYDAIRTKDKEFEVIYVPGPMKEIAFHQIFSHMPWPALPLGTGCKILRLLGWKQGSMLVAFGRDGKLLTKKVGETLNDDDHGVKAYPYSYDEKLLNEAIIEIEDENYWLPLHH